MRSVVTEWHWRRALLWLPLLLLLVCNSRSEALRERTNRSSDAITSTMSIHPSTTTRSVPSSSHTTATHTPPTTTPTAPPTTPPIPTTPPKSHGPVLIYEHRALLYLSIDDISVTFTGSGSEKFPRVNRSLLDHLGRSSVEIHNSASEIVFTQWYGPPPHNFSMKFDFSTNTSGDSVTWYIRSITHSNPNVSSDSKVLFVYQGVQYNVKAPMEYVYSCDKVTAVGYDLLDPVVLPTLELRNITVQAFCNGKLSENILVCSDKKDSSNKQTGLIIGLVVGITVVVAVIVVTVATFVMKWKKKADYDLLD